MIKVVCKTNIDAFKNAPWPSKLLACPQIGHEIEAMYAISYRDKDGKTRTIPRLRLKVVGVTHITPRTNPIEKGNWDSEPYNEVDLHTDHPSLYGLW